MIEVLAVALGAGIGCLAVRLAGPAGILQPRWAAVLLELSLGAGGGVALTSTLFFLLVLGGAASRAVLFSVEMVMLLGLSALLYFRRKPEEAIERGQPETAVPGFRWNRLLVVVLAVAWLLVLLAQADTARISPHGNWDAFAIWNLRAKILLSPGDTWKSAVSPLLERTHPDYPLLLSAFIARAWKLAGGVNSPVVPLATALLFFASLVTLLFSSLVLLRGLSSGLLACFIVVATTSFMSQISWQYADIPLGFYYLAVLVLVFLSSTAHARRPALTLVMAGAYASFAALTKNEGVLFLILSLACYFLITRRATGTKQSIEEARFWLVGALPGVVMLGCFKLFLAPFYGPLGNQTASQVFEKLGDPARYGAVIRAVFSEAVALGQGLSHPLVLLAILVVVLRFDIDQRRRASLLFGSLTLAVLFASYCGVYLVTPSGPPWRLGTSLNRLYTQIWPSFLLLVFFVIGRAQDAQPPEPVGRAQRSGRKRRKREAR